MLDDRAARLVLRALQRTRRRQHLHGEDWIDSVYKAYLTVIGIGVAIFYLSPLLGEASVSTDLVSEIRSRGPAGAGVCIAIVVALGLRSGSRGGPLALEHADVRHVLLAPIRTDIALRIAARRQLRGVLYMGGVIGGLLGYFAYLRLPGELWSWVAAGAGLGMLVALSAWGAALVASGLRLRARTASIISVAVVAWASADLVLDADVSPATQLGRLAVAPLHWSPLTAIGIVLALVLPIVGLVVVGGLSLEAAQRRAGLVGQLRFAATVQDVRTVMVLHRQLAQESARSRPRWRMPAATMRFPCWQRDWEGIARWSFGRLLRASALGIVAGLALAVVWEGATALLFVAGAALYFVGLDSAEGLGQETDHAERPAGYPVEWGDLALRHLVAPATFATIFLVPALAVVLAITWSMTALGVTAIVLVPAAIATALAAGTSLVLGAPKLGGSLSLGFPELATLGLIARQTLPPALIVVALAPLAIAREQSGSPVGNAANFVPIVLIALFGVGTWIRSRRLGPA